MKSLGKQELKSKQWVQKLSESEYAMLVELAEARGVSGAEVMRTLLRREYEKHTAKAAKK